MTHEAGSHQPRLGIWRLHLAAAPRPLLFRRDEPFDPEAPVVDVPDVMRYVATARATLRGPLVLELEGPGDPLASPESVLRILALIHEHHPDVLSGLVIHGPLLGEYTEELREFGLGYLVLRMDAATLPTAERLVSGGLHRGDKLDRAAAAELYFEEARRALHVAKRRDIPLAIRTTLIPTVNGREIEAIAGEAARAGAERMDIVPHVRQPDAPLQRGGTPTAGELEEARAAVASAFGSSRRRGARRGPIVTDWINPQRVHTVDTDALDAVDVLRVLPDPREDPTPARLLPPRRAQFIAVASRDGTLVDATLAGTPLLRIYAVTDAQIRLLGTRAFEPNLRRADDGVGNAQAFLKTLMGCRAVVATGFSARAVTLLQAVGIKPVAVAGPVEAVLDRVSRGTLRQAT
jgi:predicted Fe-Mo cluster-binding NifX family protein